MRDNYLFLNNRKHRSHFYLPAQGALPAGFNRAKVYGFPFTAIPDLGGGELSVALNAPFALVSLTGNQINEVTGAEIATGFMVQISHIHAGKQRTFVNREGRDTNVLGSGQFPVFAKSVDLLDIGDTITVDVKSLAQLGAGVTTRIEVCLIGCEVEQ